MNSKETEIETFGVVVGVLEMNEKDEDAFVRVLAASNGDVYEGEFHKGKRFMGKVLNLNFCHPQS